LPPVADLRASSASVAVAVVDAAFADPVQAVLDAMWQPVYREVDL
jgi:malate dehydrogenase (oxaloacetate-decarboxylating)